MKFTRSQFLKITIYFIGLFFIGVAYWTHRYFGQVTVDQALSTLNFSLSGTMTADPDFARRFITWCLVVPCALVLILCQIERGLFRLTGIQISRYFAALLLLAGLVLFARQYSVPAYLRGMNQPDSQFYAKNYIDPAKKTFTKTNVKSLVIIYVEGMETTYSDQSLFTQDLLTPFHRIKQSHFSFDSYEQMPGTGWTMAGIVSTQCGIPLRVMTLYDGNKMGQQLNKFLPGATCLSDILHEQGYKNVFMGGASLVFSGKGKFLKNHHYDEVYGREQWLGKGYQSAQMNGWGLEDDDLFAEAKVKLKALMQEGRLFNLTLLTVSTHGYDGSIDRYCQSTGVKDFPGVVNCSSNEISNFVNYIDAQGWMDKLNVVVLGDHLAMRNASYDLIEKAKKRTIFNMVISKQRWHKKRNEIVHFDMLPMLLDLSGIEYADGRLALGLSPLREQPKATAEWRQNLIANVLADGKGYQRFLYQAEKNKA